MLAQPKASRGRKASKPIHEIGSHPADEAPVNVYDGPYGPYIKHGKVNVSVPEGKKPQEVTLEEAVALLAEKGDAVKKTTRKKSTARKKSTTKSAKKSTAKKSTAKTAKKTKSTDTKSAAKAVSAKGSTKASRTAAKSAPQTAPEETSA